MRKRHALIYNEGGRHVRRGCEAPHRRPARSKVLATAVAAGEGSRDRGHGRGGRRRRAPAGCSSAWRAASSTPCTPPPPRRCARRPTSAPPDRRARSARRSTSPTRSASPSPPAPSAGPRWKAAPDHGRRRMHRRRRRRRRQLGIRRARGARKPRIDRAKACMKVACIGDGLVVRRARRRDQALGEAARSPPATADRKTSARSSPPSTAAGPFPSYEAMLADRSIEAIINTTPNATHLETTRAAAEAGKHVFLDKPIANTIADARAITQAAARRRWCSRWATSGGGKAISAGSRDRIEEGAFGKLVNAEANISRDRLGQDRPQLLALHRRRHARRRDAADRHPLHRRARIPAGPGQGGRAAASRGWCCPATTPTWPAWSSSTRTARSRRSTRATLRPPSTT